MSTRERIRTFIDSFKTIQPYAILSWAVVIFGLLYYGLLVSNHANSTNPDIGWTIRNGYMVLHHWQTTDSYTWTIAGKTRYDHSEWLSDTLYYLIYHGHHVWIDVFNRFFYAVLVCFSVFVSWKRTKNNLISSLLFVTIGFALWVSVGIESRSQSFTYLFFILYLYLRKERLWIWTILVPLWANLHGEYMLFIGLFVIDNLFSKAFNKLLWIPIWLLEVGLLTPMHFFTIEFPFLTLFSSDIKTYISEWQAYPFHNNVLFASLLVAFWFMYRIYREYDLSTKVMVLTLFLMSMQSMRHMVLLGLLLICYCPYPVFNAVRVSGKWMLALFAVIVAFLCFHLPLQSLNSLANKQAIQYIEKNGLGHLKWYLNIPDGSYVELNDPSTKVYWDGRSDMYTGLMGGTNFMKQFMLAHMSAEPIETMPDYKSIQGMIVRQNQPMDNQLARMTNWTRLITINGEDIYVRTLYWETHQKGTQH